MGGINNHILWLVPMHFLLAAIVPVNLPLDAIYWNMYSLGTSARKRLKITRPSRALVSLYIISSIMCHITQSIGISKVRRDPRRIQGLS